MPVKKCLAIVCIAALSISIQAMAAKINVYSAGHPVMLVDSNGSVWRASPDGLKVNPISTKETMLIARFVNDIHWPASLPPECAVPDQWFHSDNSQHFSASPRPELFDVPTDDACPVTARIETTWLTGRSLLRPPAVHRGTL